MAAPTSPPPPLPYGACAALAHGPGPARHFLSPNGSGGAGPEPEAGASPGREPPEPARRRRQPGGGLWREQQGLAPSSGGYGPLRDLPDWSFVDGRPAPPWKGQTRRRQEDEAFARRVAQLAGEMERGLQRWRDGRCRDLDAQDSRRQNRLQPKGGALRRDRGPH
ncbi:large ribosomal subunit protein mL52 [Emydura macquarii macquarii]|uniref:large ribosomal subunit protein mL52 n=1 Tax=Emydura macquarii macquarii TaxID=1129001 RepID=UPI00352A1EA1